MDKSKWVWMPHPGHLCVGSQCKFHLNTYVGKYIVSTVGEYQPDSSVREILAKCRGITLEGQGDAREADWQEKVGWEEIGYGRTYETMVFKAEKRNGGNEAMCCPYVIKDHTELDMDGYNNARMAMLGHHKMCLKWSKK